MYVPPHFSELDTSNLHDFIEGFSFATLVSMSGGEPFASHLPLLLDRQVGDSGQLIGHIARANPQWRDLDGERVLAIFQGPHTYISPTWYEAEEVVPTWNYVAVHVYGTLSVELQPDQLMRIVRRYVEYYEKEQANPWPLESVSSDMLDRLLRAIVGFTIAIDRIEGKWKLGQNHDESRRRKVINVLRGGNAAQQEIAALMSATL